jgi:two-component system response regulator HydG
MKGNRHTVSQEVMRVILDYDWPGNVRELWNAIQQMTTFNSGPLLNLADMPSALQNHQRLMESKAMAAAVGGAVKEIRKGNGQPHRSPEQPGVLTLSEMERRHIAEVLRFTNGDRTTAALLLGIGRTTLYRKMKCYEIVA